MKNLLLTLALASHLAFAGDITLDIKEAPINQLALSIVKGILQQDYVITPDAATNDAKVTISVRNLDREGVKATLSDVLSNVGLALVERRGVIYIERKGNSTESPIAPASAPTNPFQITQGQSLPGTKPDMPTDDDLDPVIYFPKFRGSDYLALAVRAAGGRIIDGTQQPQQMQQGYMMGGFNAFPAMYAQQPQAQPQQGQQANKFRDVLIYTGKPKTLAKVEKLLAQLDRPNVAVQLRGVVMEVTENTDTQRSFNMGWNLFLNRIGINIADGAVAGSSLTLRNKNLTAILSALDGDSRFRFLSEPSLRVVEGETAKLIVGQDVPVRGAISTDKNGNTIQSIEYKTAGLVFEVTPTIYDQAMRLKINQQISNVANTTTSGIDSPTLFKREATTTVQADDGELIAIAGLDESKESNSTNGLAFLPDWLKGKLGNTAKSQIVLLLEVKRLTPSGPSI